MFCFHDNGSGGLHILCKVPLLVKSSYGLEHVFTYLFTAWGYLALFTNVLCFMAMVVVCYTCVLTCTFIYISKT